MNQTNTPMEINHNKRYLIAFAKAKMSLPETADLLGIPVNRLNHGLVFLSENNNTPKDDDALYFPNLGISSIVLTPSEVDILRKKESILAVEEDIKMYASGTDELQSSTVVDVENQKLQGGILWNINYVKAPSAWVRQITGKGVKLAILDTGIAAHSDLKISGGVSFVQGDYSYHDENGHGTHCAGIACGLGATETQGVNVYGVAPECALYAIKVLNKQKEGELSYVIAGLEWCIANKIQIASLSFGITNGPISNYAQAIQRCYDNAITVVCASGNSFGTAFPWVGAPGNSFKPKQVGSSPMAVSSIDMNYKISQSSSRGGRNHDWNQVTVCAPGVEIYSTYLHNGYASMSGTSMACPHVAGLAALLYQKYPGISPYQVMSRISSTVSPIANDPIAYGQGLIDCDTATQ